MFCKLLNVCMYMKSWIQKENQMSWDLTFWQVQISGACFKCRFACLRMKTKHLDRILVKTQFISVIRGLSNVFYIWHNFAVVKMLILLLLLCLRRRKKTSLICDCEFFSCRIELVETVIPSRPVHCRKFFLSKQRSDGECLVCEFMSEWMFR